MPNFDVDGFLVRLKRMDLDSMKIYSLLVDGYFRMINIRNASNSTWENDKCSRNV